jgi:hypothetical protein
MQIEMVSGLDETNSGYIVPAYRFVVHNLLIVHGPIPTLRILESSTCLKNYYKVVSGLHTRVIERTESSVTA